jgi:hypothetical protein
MPWSNPFGRLILATVACQEGDMQAAADGLAAAVEGFDAAGMQLYAAVNRRRLAAQVGGDRGAALRGVADRWMAGQEIREPGATTRLIAPGPPD